MNRDKLTTLNKRDLVNHILDQISIIDKKRGYSSGVTTNQLTSYTKDVLVNIALTNNEYLKEYGGK